MGFRPPFGLGRVTLERPKVTKSLLPRQAARLLRVSSSHSLGRTERRRWYIPVPTAAAPSSLTALLTHRARLGALEADQNRANPQPPV